MDLFEAIREAIKKSVEYDIFQINTRIYWDTVNKNYMVTYSSFDQFTHLLYIAAFKKGKRIK